MSAHPSARRPQALSRQRPDFWVVDGGLATELERRGADLRDPLWSAKLLIEAPERIREVHRAYFEAGADVATTASYQASFEGFAQRGIAAREAEDLLRLSVQLACDARNEFEKSHGLTRGSITPIVAASIGCYGASLADGSEYRGNYGVSRARLIEFHAARLEVLAGSGADVLACETIPSRLEAQVLAELLSRHGDKPAWMSFCCRDDEHIAEGAPLSECVAIAQSAPNVFAVGVNCTAPRHVQPLLEHAARACDLPLVAYPNSGEQWDAVSRTWSETEASDDIPTLARSWHAAGARLIGGCCRTTPETIRRIRGELKRGSL